MYRLIVFACARNEQNFASMISDVEWPS